MRRSSLATRRGDFETLEWGPPGGPLAVMLHGFPDSPYTWRHLGSALAEHGWRVVAPWMRGYAPSRQAGRSTSIGTIAADAVAIHDALGASGRHSMLIGHDWGAAAANCLAAHPDSPFGRTVALAVPPLPTVTAHPRLVAQARRSWYVGYFQAPLLPERTLEALVPRLWRDWSPGYDAAEDVAWAMEAIRGRESDVLGYYRALGRPSPKEDRNWQRTWASRPHHPYLYLQGSQDGCVGANVMGVQPREKYAHVLSRVGHFLHLEAPDRVNAMILEFAQR